MPMLEPPRAGLTKTGSPSAATASRSTGSPSRTSTDGATARPSARSSTLATCLSMAAALASTPLPT